jgi:AcrR family transcriptional regulator
MKAELSGEDPRIAKTKAQLLEALMELAALRPWSEIGVAEICRKASIHRSTFYAHFEDKEDLLQRSMASLFDGLVEGDDRSAPRTTEAQLARLFAHCSERREFYLAALRGGNAFRALFCDYIERHAAARLAELQSGDELDREILGRLGAGAITSVLEWYLASADRCPPQEAASRLSRLLPRGSPPPVR